MEDDYNNNYTKVAEEVEERHGVIISRLVYKGQQYCTYLLDTPYTDSDGDIVNYIVVYVANATIEGECQTLPQAIDLAFGLERLKNQIVEHVSSAEKEDIADTKRALSIINFPSGGGSDKPN